MLTYRRVELNATEYDELRRLVYLMKRNVAMALGVIMVNDGRIRPTVIPVRLPE